MNNRAPFNDFLLLLLLAMSCCVVVFLSDHKASKHQNIFESFDAIELDFISDLIHYSIQTDKKHSLLNLLADEVFETETEQEESKNKLKKRSDNNLTCFGGYITSCLFLKRSLSTWFKDKIKPSSKPPLYTLYHCWKSFLHSF